MNLSEVQSNLFGDAIKAGWPVNPDETKTMIADQFKDSPALVEKTVGRANLKQLGIFDEFRIFQKYFPKKHSESSRPAHLTYLFGTLAEAGKFMKTAKGIILDNSLELKCQVYSWKGVHALHVTI